jgi:predicted nucleic acid-binding protein
VEQRSYEIQAEIVDIRRDVPSSEDIFFVDTNVWYLLTYPKADLPELSRRSRPKPYQIEHYPTYLENTAEAEARLYCSGLSLSELAHNIERIECEIAHGQGFSLKQFRRDYPEERAQFVEEIESSWAQVTSFAEILPLEIDASITEAALGRLTSELIDGYDLFLLETMKAHGITQVITDDGDYATVPGLQVFTANRNFINAAREQGKLLER